MRLDELYEDRGEEGEVKKKTKSENKQQIGMRKIMKYTTHG